MCHWENKWLDDCPSNYKPELYRRYIDDTFLLFRDPSHVPLFLDYLNSKHPSIKFTAEVEINKCLAFLDTKITKIDNKFTSSVFRKTTFSGLGISFFSSCSYRFKTNVIKTLLNRAFNICSSFKNLHEEFSFLRNFFFENGFPTNLINTHIKKFLAKKYSDQNDAVNEARRLYCVFPYLGYMSDKLSRSLELLFRRYFPDIKLCIISVNSRKIGSFFRYKDVLPKRMRASVVNKFSCVQCTSGYVGMITLPLYVRIAQYRGRSHRSGLILTNPSHSAIRSHTEHCSAPIMEDHFSILRSAPNSLDLKILESLFIARDKPSLNQTDSSYPLQVFI
jgi:hypothetical protein